MEYRGCFTCRRITYKEQQCLPCKKFYAEHHPDLFREAYIVDPSKWLRRQSFREHFLGSLPADSYSLRPLGTA